MNGKIYGLAFPTHKLVNEIISYYLQAQNYIRSLPGMERKHFSEVFKGANPLGKTVSLHKVKRNMLVHIAKLQW